MRTADALLVAILLLLFLMGQGRADSLDRLESGSLASSERLRMVVLGEALRSGLAPPGSSQALRRLMTRQGFYIREDRNPVTRAELWIAPLVTYDGNINGGVLKDTFQWSGYTFVVDPTYTARKGWVVGASGGLRTGIAWSEGKYLDLAVVTQAAWSPRYDIGRQDGVVSLCSRNHLTGWIFADFCQRAGTSWRQLDDTSYRETSAALVTVWPLSSGVHETTFRYSRYDNAGAGQNRLSFSIESVWDSISTRTGFTLGDPLEDKVAMRYTVNAGIGWMMWQRSFQVDVWHQKAEGGAFLGVPRKDHLNGISLAVDLHPDLSLRLEALQSHSSAFFANYDQVALNLRFEDLKRIFR